MQTIKKVSHWTTEEKALLVSLKNKGIDIDTITTVMYPRSKQAIIDMWIKLEDIRLYPRNSAPWMEEEDKALIAGMKNSEFMLKYQRGRKVTDQRRFDLTRPKGKLLNKYSMNIINNKMVVKIEPIIPEPIVTAPGVIQSMLSFTKKDLRKATESYNRQLRNISPNKSAAPSTYQYDIIRTIFREETTGTRKLRMHRSFGIELLAVSMALQSLMKH